MSDSSRPGVSLFDSEGLPWTARLNMASLIWVFVLTGGLAAIPIGVYLGLWIRAKTRSTPVLLLYMLLAMTCTCAFLPDALLPQRRADAIAVALVVLWFAGAVTARYQIGRYYLRREGCEFPLSLAYTLLFGVWYLNYRLRPEFPPDLASSRSPVRLNE